MENLKKLKFHNFRNPVVKENMIEMIDKMICPQEGENLSILVVKERLLEMLNDEKNK